MTTKIFYALFLPLLLALQNANAFTSSISGRNRFLMSLKAASEGANVPTGIKVDIITSADINPGSQSCSMTEVEDFGNLLKGHKKAILFAVPGAFTPTCSAQHLPGFIVRLLVRYKHIVIIK